MSGGQIQVKPLTPKIGSVVSGADFSKPSSFEPHAEELRALLLDRHVLFFRGLDMTADSQEAFASMFGQVQPVGPFTPRHVDNTNVEVLHTHGKAQGTDVWHVDRSWHETPPSASILYAQQVPEVGGDTMWVSMIDAVDALDPALREHVSKLEAIHHWETPSNVAAVKNGQQGAERYLEMRRKYLPLIRPVIVAHPKSGRDVLYVNTLYTTSLVGVPPTLASTLLPYLSSLATVPEFQVRWHWEPGSMAIWDNWAVQHYAVSDYYPHERVMHRVTVV